MLPDGEIVKLGGKSGMQGGLDLLGLITGSEGLLGVVVEIVAVPAGSKEMQPELTQLVDDGAAVAHRDHLALADALAARTTLEVEEQGATSVKVPETPSGAFAAMKLLELRAWTDELVADVGGVVPAVAAVAVTPAVAARVGEQPA